MAKSLDPEIVNPLITDYIQELITMKGGLVATKPTEVVARAIEEYDGHMRINSMDKMDVVAFVAAVNFYLTKTDHQARRNAKGAMAIYMDIEVADKLFKAAGLQVPYDEDDESMMGLCGSFCQSIADKLRDGLSAQGYTALEVSTPTVFKNSITGGVEFSKEQDEKQELSFFFLKHKALVVDWTLSPIPKK